MRTDRPLTLTVEQAGRLLGVGRSTAYELVGAGELESLRLRRRLVVPVAHLAARLGLTLAELWAALDDQPVLNAEASDPSPPVDPGPTRGESATPALF